MSTWNDQFDAALANPIVTAVDITLCDEGRLRGFARVTLNGELVIRGFKIVEAQSRWFVFNHGPRNVPPAKSWALRNAINRAVLTKYKEVAGLSPDAFEIITIPKPGPDPPRRLKARSKQKSPMGENWLGRLTRLIRRGRPSCPVLFEDPNDPWVCASVPPVLPGSERGDDATVPQPGTDAVIHGFDAPGTHGRPGPFGRILRLALGLLCLRALVELLFGSGPEDLASASFWFMNLLALWLFPGIVNIGLGRTWGQWRPRLLVVGVGLLAAAISYAVSGSLTGPPVWWVARLWMIYVFGHLGTSLVLASLLATPACEMRAVPHMIALLSGGRTLEHRCSGFLDRFDRWEATPRSREGA